MTEDMSAVPTAEPGEATPIVGNYDAFQPEHANAAVLQETLDRLTARLDRWGQSQWCLLTGDQPVEAITEADLEAAVYHDFELEPETVAALRTQLEQRSDDFFLEFKPLPVADCGTAFCVAGDISINNGWTFVTRVGARVASDIVRTDDVNRMLRGEYVERAHPGNVAQRILNVNNEAGNALVRGDNQFITLWAVGQLITGDRLTLPDSLPASHLRFDGSNEDGEVITAAQETPADVRRAVNFMKAVAAFENNRHADWLRGGDFDVELFWDTLNNHRDRVRGYSSVVRINDEYLCDNDSCDNGTCDHDGTPTGVRYLEAVAEFVRDAYERADA